MDFFKESLKLHRKLKGKISVESKVKVRNRKQLSLVYTPGVAEASREIARNPKSVFELTGKANNVAVLTNGSAVLGLGNIGAAASLPVMEGKCVLFKQLAGINAFPIALNVKEKEQIVEAAEAIAPVFGGINLEDISAPNCFWVERELQKRLDIPVFHDDQHGTAIVVLAAMINACRVAKKNLSSMRIVVNGAGAAGTAIARLLSCAEIEKKVCNPVGEVIVVDSKGIVSRERENLEPHKKELLGFVNKSNVSGSLENALEGADAFVGVSTANALPPAFIKKMAGKPIVFALANPVPEIMPKEAKKAGAFIAGSGRSDFSNQINNALAFPGVFRGALDARAKSVSELMKISAAHAIANSIKKPSSENILPSLLDKKMHQKVAAEVKRTAIETGNVRA